MALFGRATFGRDPYGHQSRTFDEFGSIHAHTALTSAAASANVDPCSASNPLPQTARVFRSLYNAATSTVMFDTSGYVITGGQIVEDIRQVPYAQGTIELDGRSQLDILTMSQMVANGTIHFYINENLKFTNGHETPHAVGTFIVQKFDLNSDKGLSKAVFQVFAEANGVLGATVSGDLPSQAQAFAATLGLTASLTGGPVRASIEGIAAWIMHNAGRTVRVLAGITPRPAYTGFFTDSGGTVRTIGPFNVSPAAGAAQVIQMCRWMGGFYLMVTPDGTAVISPLPVSGATANLTPPVRTYGYDPCQYPVRRVRPLPREVPANFTVTNQSAASAPRTVTVTIPGGIGAGLTENFAGFPPASLDANDAQTARAQQFAFQKMMEGAEVEIEPMADASVHAGDMVEILFNSHGVTQGFYQVIRATHPLGTEPCATLLCQYVSLNLT